MGVLVGDGFVEQSALNLQGEYLGHTKKKVDDLMSSAPGGMVFIDEAYNLGGGGMRGGLFAKEAVDQLTFNMTEPQYKGKSIVVLAGYEKEMDAMLAAANPGFRSRFKQRITFPDWDAADVVEYLRRRCAKKAFVLAAEAQTLLKERLDLVRTRPGWANARDAEWVYDELAGMRAQRLASDVSNASEEQPTFTLEDARGAMNAFDRHRPPPPGGAGGAAMLHLRTSDALAEACAEAAPRLVVVDFFADWCGPCKRVAPHYARLARVHADVARFAKVDVDEAAELAKEEGVHAMPTFHIYRSRGGMVEKVFEATGVDLTRLEAELVRHGPLVAADDGANGAPPMEEGAPPCQEVEEEREEIRIVEVEAKDVDGHNGPDVAAALQEACVELGYDESNPKRKELVAKLTGCEGSKDFPDDILGLVCQKTGKEAKDLLDELRAQVPDVLSSMREAIKEAEKEQHRLDAPIRERLKEMCLCPAGFDWHREGDGWRCNGGSHFVSNDKLNTN
jgi:thiol-disulfide isomerase/thioredoxin